MSSINNSSGRLKSKNELGTVRVGRLRHAGKWIAPKISP